MAYQWFPFKMRNKQRSYTVQNILFGSSNFSSGNCLIVGKTRLCSDDILKRTEFSPEELKNLDFPTERFEFKKIRHNGPVIRARLFSNSFKEFIISRSVDSNIYFFEFNSRFFESQKIIPSFCLVGHSKGGLALLLLLL